MKKLTLTALAFAACVQVAFSQGSVNFNNTGTFATTADRFVYVGQVGGAKLVNSNYVAALYWGRTQDALNGFAVRAIGNETLDQAWGVMRAVDPSLSSAGTWAGGTRFFVGANTGDNIFLQVRVWDLTKGATYDVVSDAFRGHSDVFPYLVPASTDATGLKPNNLRAFAVGVVPEPSTIALGVLGLGSLLLFRRKKA
jgi:hypothetical protein